MASGKILSRNGVVSMPAQLFWCRGTESSIGSFCQLRFGTVGYRMNPWRPCQCRIVSTRLNEEASRYKKRTAKQKQRLDELCHERFPEYSRSTIQSWILQGKVFVDGALVGKAGAQISAKSEVKIVAEIPKYVCRAGYKLEAALEHFACDVNGKVVLDAGLSTGGFTDCLLQRGAAHVYGVDVGYGQVAEKIRTDKRVNIMERTNLRYLTSLPQFVDIVTLDLSFISILLVMPAVCVLMKSKSSLIALIKPQFEARKCQVGGGGIVRDPDVHKEVLQKVIAGIVGHGFHCEGWMQSPLKGAEGNTEFLAYFERNQCHFLEDSSFEGKKQPRFLLVEALGGNSGTP
eukprot:c20467_g1_i2 orf=403-1437(-)